MTYVYIIVVFNLFHHQQAVLPGSYPDMNSCRAQLVQTHFTLGNWGDCELLASKPAHRLLRRHAR